ncbi:peptidoglycan recognition protein family protein [Thermicanus aegyptius]|uniref:peptidoglycan recognition protein family protein n=1 Tax=Thermicanus aegyptius TaxID=94009 RepID=UPI00040FF064|nr:peptidoglycan recognition family protein [Thermicanus aegyptius]
MSGFKVITIDELLTELKKYNHKELHVHHTWRPDHSNFNGKNYLQLQEDMKRYHIQTRGWSDIGQHVTLFPDGLFVTGRDFSKAPASIKWYNTGAFAVEMLGNFDIGHDTFGGKQKEAMLKLARFFYDRGKYIRFHRENAPKTCPGTAIDKDVFMREVKSLGIAQKTTERRGRKLELKFDWQWDLLTKALEHLKENGLLSSAEWAEKAKKKELTVDEAAWLAIILLGRKEDDDKDERD